MGKIIRLTESELIGLVKNIINEQKTDFEKIIRNWGKTIMKKLGPNFQITGSELDNRDKTVVGTYQSFFLKSIEYSWSPQSSTAKSINDIKEISCTFNARFINTSQDLGNCTISFKFSISNGMVVGLLSNPFVMKPDKNFFIEKKQAEKELMEKLANDQTLVSNPSSEPDVKEFRTYMSQKGYKLVSETSSEVIFRKKTNSFTSTVKLNNDANSFTRSSSGASVKGKSISICVEKVEECDLVFKTIALDMNLLKQIIKPY